jgi:hypothetical protein
MSETGPENNPEPNAEAKLLEGLTSQPGKTGSKRGRRKLLYILVLITVLILGLALTKGGFHPFPVIPPTPAYP